MSRIAIIGCGVVGSSWTLVFARAGHEVVVYDPSPASADATLAFVRDSLAGTPELEAVIARIRTAPTLEEAVADASYVQESSPERLPIKQELYARLDTLVPPKVVIGSSTSGLPASSFTETLATRARCLVVHPVNPPHLIPLVELVPAPWTAPEALAFAGELMDAVGQQPIRLSREINGFVVNRLQSALLGEAFRLVEDGIVSTEDVDKAVAEGLGLRWFFMGPFETIDLNASTGIAEYCRNLGPMYYELAREQADPREWKAPLVATLEAARRVSVPAEKLSARRLWRDRWLAALVAAKAQIRKELGR
ncbi:3-hydroxyacyl-CoA dehydrogenase [Ancylobacter pratisalsi]|uniref:L-gulonate 3-dehydrogenase n=1 Tax=Ancylobacter pratisalsi TaxID=1745854 RepID=A0A6P1YN77_9HYPH|nr:3-hydroxyacyl-CoA dehydrogenase [Ancylobacter pratisalsi]QIB34585.1 3-hydroxyacyl-CoA dehydrogenase [Ancylobacter pratisalsi]